MKINFPRVWGCVLAAFLGSGVLHAQDRADEKVLRYAFEVAETGFDPAQISDVYSRIATASMFDSLYDYDYLARPVKVRPRVAVGMPVISDDFRTYTIQIKPGIYFADDAAFGGKKRELTAQDFVYSYKRFFDPKTKSPIFSDLEEEKLIGMEALRRDAEKPGASFNYDKEVEGIRALDRYTLQFKMQETRPRFIYALADAGAFGAVAREVVEKYGDKIMEHPVGTGPFKLDRWTRSSKMIFVKNPNYREEFYEAEPPLDDARSQAIYRLMKGKRLPMVDRVEISVIEEVQPRWLSFLGNEHDFLFLLPEAFSYQAIPNNQLAPNLVKKRISMDRVAIPDVTLTYMNMEHPLLGGYTPDKVALRRAIALAYHTEEEIRLPRRNQAIPAQGPIQPGTYGFDAQFKTEMSEFSPARAAALLDMYGYVDRDGDGWRDMPDGKPLVLEYATQASQVDRQHNELWKKNMDRIGLRMVFKTQKWPENLKAARSGKLMMWGVASSASGGDGMGMLTRYFGPQAGNQNLSRFKHARFDAIHEQMRAMPDGPERLKLFDEAKKIAIAFAPYKLHCHRFVADMMYPGMDGYRRPVYWNEWWMHVDVDPAERNRDA